MPEKKIKGTNSKPAFSWKEVSTKDVFLWINQDFPARFNFNLVFGKVAGSAPDGDTLLKRYYTMNFSKMFF